MNRLGRICLACSTALFLVWAVGQLFRDRWWITGLCFYLPSPAVFVTLAGSAVFLSRKFGKGSAILVALLALPPLVFVALVENRWWPPTRPEARSDDLRVVHWNVAHGRKSAYGWYRMEDDLVEQAPDGDLYVFSESLTSNLLQHCAQKLGMREHTVWRHREIGVVARGQWKLVANLSRDPISLYVFQWTFDGRNLRVMVVDLPSSIFVGRDTMLFYVRTMIAAEAPDLVLGDFNAPRRSWFLSKLPDGYTHAYDDVGWGWSYTWPVPVPLWAIDQCLVGPRIEPVDYTLRTSLASDHRIQILDYRLKPSGQ